MRKCMFMLLLVVQQAMAQVNVYECDPAYVTTTANAVNSAAYQLHKPCILMDFETYEIASDYPKYVTASEFIHIKGENANYFHAGPYSGTDHFWMQIKEQAPAYEVWALNYDDLNAIQRYKKLELGIKLEGELLDRINAFLHQTPTHPNPLNPFLEWELDVNVKFVHAQTLTEKWMDGFYYQDYERNTNINDWIPLPTDFPMRVRFAPPLNGLWNTYVSITYDNNTIELPVFSFNVVESGDPGYVTVHNNKKNLQRDGNVIFPIGHVFPGPYNRENGGKAPWDYDINATNKNMRARDWINYIQDIADYINQGGRCIKLAQTAYGNLIEFEALGNYYNRLHSAWEQDKILDLCEENDVLINFNLLFQDVIYKYGPNATGAAWPWGGYFPEMWDYGPYGPDGNVNPAEDNYPRYCYYVANTNPSSMFLDSSRMEYHKQRTRYYVSRYGYSPQIYAWELMSEPFWMDAVKHADGTVTSPASTPSAAGHTIAIDAINAYHDGISNFIKYHLKNEDHLIAFSSAQVDMNGWVDYYDEVTCASNPLIDLIGINPYADASNKLVRSKERLNGSQKGTNNLDIQIVPEENTEYRWINNISFKLLKPVYLSEVGYYRFSEECMGPVGTLIDISTYPFSGIAAMHPWTGYSYGGVDSSGVITEIDRRWNWEPTIKAERFFNSGKFSTPLNTWNGFWKQGRQAENYHTSDNIASKELQYYLSEDNKSAVGYVRNRSFNVYTQRIDNSCSYTAMEQDEASSYDSPLDNFFTIYNHMGKKIYCFGVQKNQYHLVKWYDLDTNHIISQVYKSDNKNRLKLNHPVLNVGFPIVWFTVQNVDANGIPIISSSDENMVILEEERTENENYLDVSQSNGVFQKVVPNPFENELLIESSVEDVYRIIDLKGATILTGKVHIGQTRISTDMLNKGFYYITFANYGYSQKLVKQ